VYHVLGRREENEDEEEALPDTASDIANDDEQVSDILSGTAAETKSVRSFAVQGTYEGLVSEQDAMLGSVDNALNVANKESDVNGIDARAEYVATAVQKEIDFDTARYPSLDPDTQRDIAVKFQALHQRVKDEDFYQCRFIEYGKEMIRYTALFTIFVFTLNNGWYMVSACFLGLFWHQIMFTAHDAGHRGISRNITTDTWIGIFVADFCCGLSIGWWKSSHNVHHLVTNAPVRTPCYVVVCTSHSPLTLTA
jgi:delta8-fatty-acid desaturase